MWWNGSNLVIKGTNFTLDSSGNVTATNVDLSGKITADSGSIAGWGISPSSIGKGGVSLVSTANSRGLRVSDSFNSERVRVGDFPVKSLVNASLYSSSLAISEVPIAGTSTLDTNVDTIDISPAT